MSTTSSGASSATLEPLLAFCAAHPVAGTDAARLLGHLKTGPRAIIDWRGRGVVVVLLDALIGADKTVPFEVVGLVDGVLPADLAADIITELAQRGRELGALSIELAVTSIWTPHRDMLEGAGYRPSYTDYDMICRDPAWGDDQPLAAGAVWHDAAPDWIDDYIQVLQDGFADTPGAFIPSPEEVRRYLSQADVRGRILVEHGQGIGLLRYTVSRNYINAVVRAGGQRGRGLGRIIMDEARRCLVKQGGHRAPMRLTVVDTNTAAIELYRRCHFEIEKQVQVLVRHLDR